MTVPPAGQTCATCSNWLNGECHYGPPHPLVGWLKCHSHMWCAAWGLVPASVGPTGATGATGAQGPAGADGVTQHVEGKRIQTDASTLTATWTFAVPFVAPRIVAIIEDPVITTERVRIVSFTTNDVTFWTSSGSMWVHAIAVEAT